MRSREPSFFRGPFYDFETDLKNQTKFARTHLGREKELEQLNKLQKEWNNLNSYEEKTKFIQDCTHTNQNRK